VYSGIRSSHLLIVAHVRISAVSTAVHCRIRNRINYFKV